MAQQKFASDYNDVAARLAEFRTKHPEGSLQPVEPLDPFRVVEIGQDTLVVYTAAAYRTPDDPRPGIGVAQEAYPGKTPYTRGSELQNAETSAWGRAIVAALAADTKKGIASAEEVRNRQAESEAPAPRSAPPIPPVAQSPADAARARLRAVCKAQGLSLAAAVEQFGTGSDAKPLKDTTDVAGIDALIKELGVAA
ncbi:MAG: hypothetical protein NVSMB4_01620 [Acidimicrobiales bacterium]